jgi:hypothetical protein
VRFLSLATGGFQMSVRRLGRFPIISPDSGPSGGAEIGRMQNGFSALATRGDTRCRLQLFFREGVEAAAFVTCMSRHIFER